MLFQYLGRIVARSWPFLLAGWCILLVLVLLVAPSWSAIAEDQEFSFLPPNVPSRHADEVFAKAFPQSQFASNIVLVLHRTEDDTATWQRDLTFIEKVLEPGLHQIAEKRGGLAREVKPASDDPFAPDQDDSSAQPASKRSIIGRIQTPNAPGAGALLVSPDRKAMLVVMQLVPEFSSHLNWPVIDEIENLVSRLRQEDKIPAGVEISLTGSAVIGRDHSLAELKSVRATGALTVILVAVLLIFIYRAPLLAIIPLATVFLAVQVSLNVLALLSRTGYITIFQGLQIYITILAYGAGVDYCLFLMARYREELDRGASIADAVARAVGNVGTALAASAGTVMCGIAMMAFASFGKFQMAGLAIPLSLFIVLCATLTFSPALLCLAGRWAFWPQRQLEEDAPSTASLSPKKSFFSSGQLLRLWDHVGQFLLRRAGTAWLVTVAVMAPFAVAAGLLHNHLSYDLVGDLPDDATSVAGTRLLQNHFPAGIMGPITVLLINEKVDFGSDQGRMLIEQVTDHLRRQQEPLGLADIRSLTAPLGISPAAHDDFMGMDMPKETRAEAVKQAALKRYTTALGERKRIGTRLELVPAQSPFAPQSTENLAKIEQTLQTLVSEDAHPETQLYFAGTVASVRDLTVVMQHDRLKIEILVMASVFVILLLLFRDLLIAVYLLLSVLFSYFTTLGVAFAVFWLIDPSGFTGIDWKVAIFLFTILIAVGEDYNIFLMTRVHEEQRQQGPVRGILIALDRTGPIISSCGIIMAGTFASLLLAGTLTEMKQLGFTLAFGVLLDTFIVRPILVPSFLVLLHTGRLSLGTAGSKATRSRSEVESRQSSHSTTANE